MTSAIDPKPTRGQVRLARRSVLCSWRDDRCYVAELYLILIYFSALGALHASGITFLNARARSSQ